MNRPSPGIGPGPVAAPAGGLSRRQVLLSGGGGLLVAAVLGGGATGCGSDRPPEPDPLEEQLAAARADSALAAAAANAAPPPLRPALTEVSAERARHATALIEELARAAGRPTPAETETATATPTASSAPVRPPGLPDVVAALRRSAESAARLVPTLSGYRAGLMGSIAAACTASYTVGLEDGRKPQ